jgi:hypothetical protein
MLKRTAAAEGFLPFFALSASSTANELRPSISF